MYPSSQTPNFYPSMLRNLNVLRDIHRLITEARARHQRQITFRDERGDTWQLIRVGDQAHRKPRHSSQTKPVRPSLASGL